MKFVHLLPVLAVAAAFGAAHALPNGSSRALALPPVSPELAAVVPPWLAHEAHDDPHAGLYPVAPHDAPDDPHAGLYPTAAHDLEDPYQRVGLEPPREVNVAKVERSRATNGHSVAEVFTRRATLAGKKVRVRGTIVKLNEGILGKTYLHLQDGSGDPERGNHDLTVTTTDRFELGETVELEGVLSVDQDVGAGYQYEALLGEATRVAS